MVTSLMQDRSVTNFILIRYITDYFCECCRHIILFFCHSFSWRWLAYDHVQAPGACCFVYDYLIGQCGGIICIVGGVLFSDIASSCLFGSSNGTFSFYHHAP